jgi:nucleotidyltransferase/DNA polymerase involved in DNA repair
LAAGKFPAYVAATSQRPDDIHLIHPGCEAAFLASFPMTLLPFGKEPQRRLKLLGITTICHYAALPRAAVFAQFGEKGRRLHKWASGQDERRVPFFKPERVEYAEHEFDAPVNDGQILEAVLHRLAENLAGRLAADTLECREVALALRLEDRLTRDGSLNLGQPVASSGGIYKKLWFLLKQITLSGGVMQIEVRLSAIRPVLPRQLSLFDDLDGGEHLRETLVDLTARHGACFFAPLLHHPDALLPEYRFSLEDVASA